MAAARRPALPRNPRSDRWGENNGFDDVWLSEHHFFEDGYLPSILAAAAAIAARTSRIRIASGVLLIPFHNPIRLAEDIATIDVISGGWFELGVGIGYKREEFSGFGVSSKDRGARTDQSLDIIRRALSGETVTFKSEFFDFQNVGVTPQPIQRPHRPIWLGLGSFTPAALRRAVRFGDGFPVPGANRDVYDRHVAELKRRTGRQITFVSPAAFGFSSYPTTPRKSLPRLLITSSIRSTITRYGSRLAAFSVLLHTSMTEMHASKVDYCRWSIPTPRYA